MINILFMAVLTVGLAGWLRRAFKALPEERWQMLAVIPAGRTLDGAWRGVNLTYYGFFTALAYTVALAVLVLMLGALDVPAGHTVALVAALLAICVPASRLVAGWVEGKKYTFTVGGAAFVGILTLPALVWLARRYIFLDLPMLPALAAFGTAYCFGEGLGRLACISFGCCHGRPLTQCPGWLRTIFARRNFVFRGATKKIAWQAGQADMPVLPIQAVTSVVCLCLGLAGMGLFLFEHYKLALVLTLAGSQLWRVISEFVRSDYRGGAGAWRLTAYQIMALAGALIAVPAAWLPYELAAIPTPALSAGLAALWRPGVILAMQAVWIAMFLYTGCSRVTSAQVSFHVRPERI